MSGEYVVLCDAVKNEVVKLLLTNGSEVNSKNPNTDTPLHFAVINGDIKIVQMLLDRGANINAANQYCDTPLHNAVKSKKLETVELLLNQGAYVNARNISIETPLHLAVGKGSEEIIKLLLQHGAHVDCVCTSTFSESYMPLWFAVEEGHEEVVQLLLEYGGNVNARDKDGKTVLQFAVEKGHEKVVQRLLEYGAKVDAQDKNGKTVLHLAVEKVHEEVFKLLLEYGANVNTQDEVGKTVLHFAVKKGHEKFVKLLLECGAKVDAQDKGGKTVLHLAVEKGCSVIIDHVLKHCPDVNNKSNRSALNVAVQGYGDEYGKIVENLLQYGFTVNPEDVNNCELLHAAVEKGYFKIVEELLKYGIDVNKLYKSTYGKGSMPLHVATKNKQEEVAKLLISYGADVNAQDETRKLPIFYATLYADLKITELLLTNKSNVKDNPELLHIAVKNECIEIVEVLLEHGVDVNTTDECGRTALHCTALDEDGGFFLDKGPDINVKGEIAKLLLSRGANVNARTKKGTTTLHAATQVGYVKVVQAVLEYNADVNCTVNTDVTPLHIAANKGHLEIVELLLKFGADIDRKDEYGRTALHIASEEGHEQIVIAVLEHGADINIMTKDNRTPHDCAMACSHSFYNRGTSYDSDDYYDPDYDYHGRVICGCESIAGILKRHIFKMKTANLFVSKKNLLHISHHWLWSTRWDPVFSLSVSNNDKVSDFQKECEEEIASMKTENVSNTNVSFYDILTKGIRQLAMYAGNEIIVQILRSDDYKVKFPIYASMINSNFRKGERRKELLEKGNKIFHFLFNNFPQLPHDCTEKIFSYLSDEDLRILIDACKPLSLSSPITDINNVVITSNIPKMS
jgi:ankyrin repeat protein